eukprot:gene43354-66114_t
MALDADDNAYDAAISEQRLLLAAYGADVVAPADARAPPVWGT